MLPLPIFHGSVGRDRASREAGKCSLSTCPGRKASEVSVWYCLNALVKYILPFSSLMCLHLMELLVFFLLIVSARFLCEVKHPKLSGYNKDQRPSSWPPVQERSPKSIKRTV